MARRILVIGCPGSGKSTLARDRTHLTREELVAVLRPIPASPRWIIDGNCNDTMTLRVEACEAVIFLEENPALRRGKPPEGAGADGRAPGESLHPPAQPGGARRAAGPAVNDMTTRKRASPQRKAGQARLRGARVLCGGAGPSAVAWCCRSPLTAPPIRLWRTGIAPLHGRPVSECIIKKVAEATFLTPVRAWAVRWCSGRSGSRQWESHSDSRGTSSSWARQGLPSSCPGSPAC